MFGLTENSIGFFTPLKSVQSCNLWHIILWAFASACDDILFGLQKKALRVFASADRLERKTNCQRQFKILTVFSQYYIVNSLNYIKQKITFFGTRTHIIFKLVQPHMWKLLSAAGWSTRWTPSFCRGILFVCFTSL